MFVLPDPNQLLVGALIFLRIGAILFALPVIGDSPTPVRVRLLLSLSLTIGLYSHVPMGWAPTMAADPWIIAGYILKEVLVGLVIGYATRMAFDGAIMAASIVSYQMGFGTASMFVPDYQNQLDSFTAFHRMLVMLIFLSLGLHQIFISSIVDTFHLIPGGAARLNGPLFTSMLNLVVGLVTIAIQLSAPILVAMLFTMAAMGLMARAVPNLNVFVMSFPVSFVVGLIVYIATLPLFPGWLQDHFIATKEDLHGLTRLLNQ